VADSDFKKKMKYNVRNAVVGWEILDHFISKRTVTSPLHSTQIHCVHFFPNTAGYFFLIENTTIVVCIC
jgi:hypothetical protein